MKYNKTTLLFSLSFHPIFPHFGFLIFHFNRTDAGLTLTQPGESSHIIERCLAPAVLSNIC